MTKAAVIQEFNGSFEVWDVELSEPGAGQVIVDLGATGICHSDYSAYAGLRANNMRFPAVLGHEASGVVRAVAPDVTTVEVGDHVVVAFKAVCGSCWYCTRGQGYLCTFDKDRVAAAARSGNPAAARMSRDGAPVFTFGVGTYAESILVSEHNLATVPTDIPFDVAALLGCGVLTGFGAAVNTAQIREGDSVAVIGCGGVGLSAIQGARVAGAAMVIGVDLVDSKLSLAASVGATHSVNGRNGDAVAEVQRLTGGRGADHVIEVAGLEPTINQAIAMTRPGGETVLVGLPSQDTLVTDHAVSLIHQNRTIRGSMYGSSDFRADIVRLTEFYRSGELLIDQLISRRLDLTQIGEAFAALESGAEARSVVVF